MSFPERWQLPLWHLGPALLLGAFGVAGTVPEIQQLSLWLRGGRDPSPRPRLGPPGRFPKPAAAAKLQGLLLPPIPVPAPVGTALKPLTDFPKPVGGSMSSRPYSKGTLCAECCNQRRVRRARRFLQSLRLLNFALLQSWWDERLVDLLVSPCRWLCRRRLPSPLPSRVRAAGGMAGDSEGR